MQIRRTRRWAQTAIRVLPITKGSIPSRSRRDTLVAASWCVLPTGLLPAGAALFWPGSAVTVPYFNGLDADKAVSPA